MYRFFRDANGRLHDGQTYQPACINPALLQVDPTKQGAAREAPMQLVSPEPAPSPIVSGQPCLNQPVPAQLGLLHPQPTPVQPAPTQLGLLHPGNTQPIPIQPVPVQLGLLHPGHSQTTPAQSRQAPSYAANVIPAESPPALPESEPNELEENPYLSFFYHAVGLTIPPEAGRATIVLLRSPSGQSPVDYRPHYPIPDQPPPDQASSRQSNSGDESPNRWHLEEQPSTCLLGTPDGSISFPPPWPLRLNLTALTLQGEFQEFDFWLHCIKIPAFKESWVAPNASSPTSPIETTPRAATPAAIAPTPAPPTPAAPTPAAPTPACPTPTSPTAQTQPLPPITQNAARLYQYSFLNEVLAKHFEGQFEKWFLEGRKQMRMYPDGTMQTLFCYQYGFRDGELHEEVGAYIFRHIF